MSQEEPLEVSMPIFTELLSYKTHKTLMSGHDKDSADSDMHIGVEAFAPPQAILMFPYLMLNYS